jgi:hypothetical protein
MCVIILVDIAFVIRPIMLDLRHRSFPVKGTVAMRYDEAKIAIGPTHPSPLPYRPQRIGDVLKAMGRQDDVIGVFPNAVQVSGFSEELDACWPSSWCVRRPLFESLSPQRLSGVVDVVDGTQRWIERKHPVPPEATARPPDFEARGTLGSGKSFLGEGGPSSGQAVSCGLDESQRALATPSGAYRAHHDW